MTLFPAKTSEQAKFMASEGNSALTLPVNVDRQPPLQQDLMNFQLQNFQQCNKSL